MKQCTAAIEEIQESFDIWYIQTKSLRYALQDTLGTAINIQSTYRPAKKKSTGQKRRLEEVVKNDIRKTEVGKKLKGTERIEEEKRMKEKSEAMEHILRRRDCTKTMRLSWVCSKVSCK